VPHGFTITGVSTGVVAGAGASSFPVQATLHRLASNGTSTTLGATGSASGVGAQTLSTGAISVVVDLTNYQYVMRVSSSDLASATPDEIRFISVAGTALGPHQLF
jgi:hypothetical protein